jgi:hypothetical protein
MYSPDNHSVIIPFRMWVCSGADMSVSHEEVIVAVAGTVSGSYWYNFWQLLIVSGTVAGTVTDTIAGTVTDTIAGSY